MPDIAFVNGRFLPLADATVSIEDRGFQFGDGIYEVIRTYGGRPFELEAHLARLDRSAEALDLRQPYSRQQWVQYIREAIQRAAFPEAKVYMQVTRGVAPRDHAYVANLLPTVVMTVREFHPMNPSVRAAGVEAMTIEDIRWGRCDIKSVNLLANVLARQQAKQAQVFETILIKDGQVTEGAVSNVMVVRDGAVVTAPEGPRILSGVTRAVVLRCGTTRAASGTGAVLLSGRSLRCCRSFSDGYDAWKSWESSGSTGSRSGTASRAPITQRLAAQFLERTA